MQITPVFAFDHCHEKYREAWEECFVKMHLGAVDASALTDHRWKPNYKPRAEDFVVDFTLAGRQSLLREGMPARLILFQTFYAAQADYDQVRKHLRLTEMGWVRHTDDIRKIVGRELMNREIFPPNRYFGR